MSSTDASLIEGDGETLPGSGLSYPFAQRVPGLGEVTAIADGVGWTRIWLPGSLGHINCWLLDDDDDGVTICDTGMGFSNCRANWETLFAGPLAGRPVRRVVCTHFHPDHIGLAGWLSARDGARIWMTRGEWLTAKFVIADAAPEVPAEIEAMRRGAGWSEAQIEAEREKGWGRLQRVVSTLPVGYRRIVEGETLSIGARDWRVVIGSGHSPEHACLLDEREGLLIAGDQILPKISSNVSLSAAEPEADPLGDWLASIDKLMHLPADLLVLPAHGEPFRGVRTRLTELGDVHRDRLDALAAFIATPRRAVDCFPLLFSKPIGEAVMAAATGESLAHLRRLEVEGRAVREVRDGVWWFAAA